MIFFEASAINIVEAVKYDPVIEVPKVPAFIVGEVSVLFVIVCVAVSPTSCCDIPAGS